VTIVLGLVVGLLAVRCLLLTGRDIVDSPVLRRLNYRGVALPTAAGIFVVLAVLAVEAGRDTFGVFGIGDEPGASLERPLVLFACLGFGLLGFVDDVLGTEEDRGFRGHLRALTHGRLTTGLVKIVGGAAVAFVLVGLSGELVSGKRVVADAVLIALAANLGNLFDRAPGRAIKVGVVLWVPLAIVAGTGAVGVAVAPVIGAFLGLLADDLHERLMLGDAGANVLGAVLGLAAVLELGRGARNGVLVGLVLLTIAAELVSFSRVITRVRPLRAFDELGRRVDRGA
jgi:UDP-N-acetylmuramyl pentapeptide phosphotransferase/UDP-N-acetylglucosamine-1-phosphate transferase